VGLAIDVEEITRSSKATKAVGAEYRFRKEVALSVTDLFSFCLFGAGRMPDIGRFRNSSIDR
jgi:hypothetical protein